MASEIAEHNPAAGFFVMGSSSSEWYEHLKPRGSCLRLYSLLVKERGLVHQLGPKGITILHKGVQHGCVRLVKFILVNMFDDEGYCTCRVHGPGESRLTREQLLRKACEDDITAVQMAVVSGSPKMVLLLNWAIEKNKVLEKELLSSKDDEVTPSDATRVLIERVQERSTGNALLFIGAEWDMEGEDMRHLFEARSLIGDCDPPSPTELGPPDAEGEVMEESLPASVNDTGSSIDTESSNVVIPDVKDHTIDSVYDIGSKESVMIPKVYDLIERILEDPGCFEADDQRAVEWWKDECKKDVDFEFVPVAHVFLHFLFGASSVYFYYKKVPAIFERIILACKEYDLKEEGNRQGSGSMVATLFKILDPRGRTILHAAFHSEHMKMDKVFGWLDKLDLNENSTELSKECMNSKDGAGRTILHLMCTFPSGNDYLYGETMCLNLFFKKWDGKNQDCNSEVSPLCEMEWTTLKKWCFPSYDGFFRAGCSLPMLLAILFNSTRAFNHTYLYSKEWNELGEANFYPNCAFGPLQLAACLGRSSIIEEILKQPNIKPIMMDLGINPTFPSYHYSMFHLPAIHCAALSGQVEALQSILKFPVYDPIIQHQVEGTALHLILKRKNFNRY